jgi:hypothetical protein
MRPNPQRPVTVETTHTASPGDPADGAEPGDPAAPAAESADAAPPDRLARLLPWAVLAVVLLPILVAAVRVATSDWVPVGDSALIAIRSQDVLGGQVPLLGMWASTSWAVDLDMNHPGPLLFDTLAVPVALFGNAAGSAIGMALINGVSVVGLFLVVRRRGGAVGGALALAVGALLCWSLGSAVLVEPWHATAVLLPFLLLAALAWSVADGDLVCLPFAVVIASFILQTNLSYAVLVPAVLLWGVAGWALGRRGDRSTGEGASGDGVGGGATGSGVGGGATGGGATGGGVGGGATGSRATGGATGGGATDERPARGRSLGVVAAVTVVAALVCWAQPLAEQFFGDGQGNVSRLWQGLREDQQTVDWSTAVRSVAEVVAMPPWWLRPSYGDSFTFGAFGNPLPSLLVSLVGLAVVAALLVVAGRAAQRRGDRTALTGVATAGVVLAAALVSANQTPTSVAGTVAYQVRFLWPVAAFVTLALVFAAARQWAPALDRRMVVAGAGVAVVASLLNLPASHQATTAPEATEPVAADVVADLAGHDLPSPLRVECWEGVFDPYCEAVLAGLADQGVDFVQVDGQALRQLGTDRAWSGDPAVPALTVMSGELAVFGPAEAEQLVLHEPLDADEADELREVRESAAAALTSGELALNERGRRLAREGSLPSVDRRDPSDIDGAAAVEAREYLFGTYRHDLEVMVGEGLLEADSDWATRLDRYLELQTRVDDETVAVYLTTTPSEPFPTGD